MLKGLKPGGIKSKCSKSWSKLFLNTYLSIFDLINIVLPTRTALYKRCPYRFTNIPYTPYLHATCAWPPHNLRVTSVLSSISSATNVQTDLILPFFPVIFFLSLPDKSNFPWSRNIHNLIFLNCDNVTANRVLNLKKLRIQSIFTKFLCT